MRSTASIILALQTIHLAAAAPHTLRRARSDLMDRAIADALRGTAHEHDGSMELCIRVGMVNSYGGSTTPATIEYIPCPSDTPSQSSCGSGASTASSTSSTSPSSAYSAHSDSDNPHATINPITHSNVASNVAHGSGGNFPSGSQGGPSSGSASAAQADAGHAGHGATSGSSSGSVPNTQGATPQGSAVSQGGAGSIAASKDLEPLVKVKASVNVLPGAQDSVDKVAGTAGSFANGMKNAVTESKSVADVVGGAASSVKGATTGPHGVTNDIPSSSSNKVVVVDAGVTKNPGPKKVAAAADGAQGAANKMVTSGTGVTGTSTASKAGQAATGSAPSAGDAVDSLIQLHAHEEVDKIGA